MFFMKRFKKGRECSRKTLTKQEKIERDKNKANLKAKKKVEKSISFTKLAIAFVLINGELQIWASYILAFLGRDAIAEALSQQIVVTIIGTLIGYFIKALVENLSKYTTMFGDNLEFIEHEDFNINEVEEEICNNELIISDGYQNDNYSDESVSDDM